MNKIIRLLILMILFPFVSEAQNLNKENIATAYRPDDASLHPIYRIFHQNDSISLVFYEVNLAELTYKRADDSTTHFARATFHYDIYRTYNGKNLVDSGSAYIYDISNYGKDVSSLGHFEIKIKEGYNYVMIIRLEDMNADAGSIHLIDIDKTDELGRQNFYLKASDNLPMVYDYVERNKNYWVIQRDSLRKYAFVKYFKPNLSAAHPPMTGGMPKKRTIKADTTYRLAFENGISEAVQFSRQGYYHIYLDSSKQKGFSVFQFTSNYPYITTPMQMLMPLRYLTSKNEFKSLATARDTKKAVDEFWIKIAGSKERARRLIRLYYNRVQQANMMFYSDREGWMTDRGMIYIVFGPPDRVYRNEMMETWYYGYQKGNSTLKFDFYKTDNPFTNEDFLLNRTPAYATPWHNALEIWRR